MANENGSSSFKTTGQHWKYMFVAKENAVLLHIIRVKFVFLYGVCPVLAFWKCGFFFTNFGIFRLFGSFVLLWILKTVQLKNHTIVFGSVGCRGNIWNDGNVCIHFQTKIHFYLFFKWSTLFRGSTWIWTLL